MTVQKRGKAFIVLNVQRKLTENRQKRWLKLQYCFCL